MSRLLAPMFSYDEDIEELGRGLARDRCRKKIIKHDQFVRVEPVSEAELLGADSVSFG